jgi:hypothetical protein
MSDLTFKVTLVVGDWSGDGHGQTDTIIIESNLDAKKIMSAYKKGSKKLGFDWINDVGAKYEDNLLPIDKLKKLIEHGLNLEEIFYDWEVEEAQRLLKDDNSKGVQLWSHSYTTAFLFITKLGNKTFEYNFIVDDNRLNIGGYGLFE